MQLFDLFIRPPGDVLYFILVVVGSIASLALVLGQRMRDPDDPVYRRYTVALADLVISWVLLMVGALLALLLLNVDTVNLLPPLERAINVVVLLLLAWAFLTADHQQWGRLPSLLLIALIAATGAGYALTALQWINVPVSESFNATTYALPWLFAPLLIAAAGLLVTLVYFRLIMDAPLKMVFFVVLIAGYAVAIFELISNPPTGHYAGSVRMALVAAIFITLLIVYRAVTRRLEAGARVGVALSSTQPLVTERESNLEPTPPANASSPQQTPAAYRSPIERESVQLLRALGMILEEATPSSIPMQVILSTLELTHADVGALLRLHDANYADIIAVYDRIMKRSKNGLSLNLDDQPTLVNAIERRAQRPLFEDRNPNELADLYNRIDVHQMGPTYFQPLMHNGEMIGILMVGLPYTKRELSAQEEELLKVVGVIAAGLLALSFMAMEANMLAEERAIQAIVQGVPPSQIDDESVLAVRRELQASLSLAREQINDLGQQVVQLKTQLDRERTRIASALGDSEDGLSISQKIVAFSDQQDRLKREREELMRRLQEAEAAMAGASASDDTTIVKGMISSLERERDELLRERNRLQQELESLQTSPQSEDGMIVPTDFQNLVERMNADNAYLQQERDQLEKRLEEVYGQLRSYGITDGPMGLSQLISQLYEQRSNLQARNQALMAERDTLIKEREQFADQDAREQERKKLIRTLQVQLKHLAADREAAVQQRDQMRQERDEIISKLESVKQHRTRLLAQVSGYQLELQEAHDELTRVRLDVQQLADERSNLLNQLAGVMAEKNALEVERDQLLARSSGDRERIQQIGKEGFGAMQVMVAELSSERNKLEHELNQTRTSLANALNQIEELRLQVEAEAMGGEAAGGGISVNSDLLMSLVQELRTPMTSMVGYVDLLLSESVGILGEMQRRFLQRVLSNVNRLAGMIEDLVKVAQMDTGQFSLVPEPIDVVALLEDAITAASVQFREKGLTVRLRLEDNLPNPVADRDAISQVIGQLLSNAYLVSPPDTEIIVTAQRRRAPLGTNGAAPVDTLFISIEDRGGGIAPEDQPRVFARKYKAENPLIQGLGDTGVGLSIARVLVESHQGRLWLESRENVGSIFNFVLPLVPHAELKV